MNWTALRERFVVLDRYAYLNAGTNGPLARETIHATALLQAWEAVHGRAGKPYFDEMLERRERVRVRIAEQLAVPAANVALTDSTTRAVHASLGAFALAPGDEVVTTDSEHFGLLGPLVASGATLRFVPIRELTAAELFDAIAARVTPRTRLLALSAVCWLDGKVIPWRELREQTGVPVLVDGAQSVGAIAVDATSADFYTVSAQKWLCGPDATGALYVREPETYAPRLVSYPAAASVDLHTGAWEPKPGAARFDTGFAPPSSLAGLEAALTGLPQGRFERARELAERCRSLLAEAGYEVVTEPGQATLVSFRCTGDPVATRLALYDRGVVLRDLPGTGLLRASVGWWNDEDDLARLVEALTDVA
ncbi:MAG TPA: aminotransferase class V-fold PLP-dependent enzyme [Gaiellaceae bacterium]|nr:aminotransferase class V-fold PLP-dependent enzyme [Gaiellaceae bacterium]